MSLFISHSSIGTNKRYTILAVLKQFLTHFNFTSSDYFACTKFHFEPIFIIFVISYIMPNSFLKPKNIAAQFLLHKFEM